MRARATAAVLLVAGALALWGCGAGSPKFKSSDVTGAGFGRDFALTDAAGKPRTLADYRGKVVVLFFGYTQCPDVCPTTLAALAQTMKTLIVRCPARRLRGDRAHGKGIQDPLSEATGQDG